MFGIQSIAAMAFIGAVTAAMPVAAAIIYKKLNKDAPVPPVVAGAVVFVIFAMGLEQALHTFMLPLVTKNDVIYVLYGAFAAGIFEETGRFIAFKTALKKYKSPKAAVMYGIGHGGCEAILILGASMISGIVIAVSVNAMGLDRFVQMSVQGRSDLESAVRAQISAYASMTFSGAAAPLFERAVSIIFHIAMSVLVFESARVGSRLWLFPACILAHAALDIPAAMYQRGLIGLTAAYAAMTLLTVVAVFAAVMSYRRMRKAEEAGCF